MAGAFNKNTALKLKTKCDYYIKNNRYNWNKVQQLSVIIHFLIQYKSIVRTETKLDFQKF